MSRTGLALVLVLAACGDAPPPAGTEAGTAGSTSAQTTGTSGQDPTTSPTTTTGPVASTGASDSMTGGSTSTTDATTTSTTSAGTATTGSTSTTAIDASSTGGPMSTDTSTGPGGCQGPGDCPPPGECRDATCSEGVCGEQPQPPETPCAGGVCDGDGACVECLGPSDCGPGEFCAAGACVAASCMDGFENGGETDVDCGGPSCPPCAPGEACGQGSDCASGVCTGGVCQAASCGDGVKNGAETDLDCGGGTCPKCQNGKLCGAPSDCTSDTCTMGTCVAPGPACLAAQPDPATGQRCPLFMSCTQSAECGVFQGCQQWFCNNAKTCELNALVGCFTPKGGGCNAGVVFTQHDDPPVDKRFVPPDNVNFRELASLAFTVTNNTASDLYLDKLPLELELMGGASKFDVSSAKIFDNSGGTEHDLGDLIVCLTADPFTFPANGVLGPCAGSAFSRVPKGGSNTFIVNLAFAKEKTFIAGRSYRLKLASLAGVVFKVGFNGPNYVGTSCGVPPEGFTGAWVTAQNP